LSIIRLYRLILDITAIVLFIMIYLYLISGYGLIKTSTIEEYSGGLIGRHNVYLLHLNPMLRLGLILVTALHGTTGFTLLSYRIKSRRYRLATITFIHSVMVILTLFLLAIEFS